MWKKDKENYEKEEKKLLEKIKMINEENAKFLTEQMDSKKRKQKMIRMNQNEVKLNKKLLIEANQKLGLGIPKSLQDEGEENDMLSVSGKSAFNH